MVGKPSRRPQKPQGGKLNFVDGGIDHSTRVFLADTVRRGVRERCLLYPILPLDEPPHSPKLQSSEACGRNRPGPQSPALFTSVAPIERRHLLRRVFVAWEAAHDDTARAGPDVVEQLGEVSVDCRMREFGLDDFVEPPRVARRLAISSLMAAISAGVKSQCVKSQ
jgi:hypothetical protein